MPHTEEKQFQLSPGVSLVSAELFVNFCIDSFRLLRLFAQATSHHGLQSHPLWFWQPGLDGTRQTLSHGFSLSRIPGPRFDLRRGGGLSGWTDVWTGLGEGTLARGLAVKLSPQPRTSATSPGCSRQITGDSDRGGE